MAEDNLLKKWLNNDLNEEEKSLFNQREDYAINQQIIEKAEHFKASKFSSADDFNAFKKAYNNRPKVKSITWIRPLLRIASVVVIGLAVYFTLFNSSMVEQRTLASEKSKLTLPDQSLVTLNAETEIKYDNDDWDNNRQLNLKGEAFFKVAKGKTFDVITDNGTVTVVGTQFNVKSRDNYFEVICYEGIVKVSSDTIVRRLLAGDSYRILNNVFTQDKISDVSPQWTSNRSRFKAIPLNEVFKELERLYAVKIEIKNTDKGRLFTGSFTHNNLEQALEAVTQPMQLKFKISSSNQVLIDGNTD